MLSQEVSSVIRKRTILLAGFCCAALEEKTFGKFFATCALYPVKLSIM